MPRPQTTIVRSTFSLEYFSGQNRGINRIAPQMRVNYLFWLSMTLSDRHFEGEKHLMFLSLSEPTKTRPTEVLGKISTVPQSTVHRSTRAQGSIGPRAFDTPRQPQSTPSNSGIFLERLRTHALPLPSGPPLADSPRLKLPHGPFPRPVLTVLLNHGEICLLSIGWYFLSKKLAWGPGWAHYPSSHVNLESIWAPCQGRGLALTQRPPFLGHSSRGVSTHATDNLHPPLLD